MFGSRIKAGLDWIRAAVPFKQREKSVISQTFPTKLVDKTVRCAARSPAGPAKSRWEAPKAREPSIIRVIYPHQPPAVHQKALLESIPENAIQD